MCAWVCLLFLLGKGGCALKNAVKTGMMQIVHKCTLEETHLKNTSENAGVWRERDSFSIDTFCFRQWEPTQQMSNLVSLSPKIYQMTFFDVFS